jgi:SAM-dependent methyltransferase
MRAAVGHSSDQRKASLVKRRFGPAVPGAAPVQHKHDAVRAVERLDIKSSHTVLDLGCGDGHHSRLIPSGPEGCVVSLDLSLAELRCVLRSPGLSPARRLLVCGNALSLPFPDRSFDRVVCSLVLYLLPVQKALGELRRVMKPGGKAYVRVPMLSMARAWKAWTGPKGLHAKAYGLAHVANGLLFGVLGTQMGNKLLRHDSWACYLPRSRFIGVVRDAGLRIDHLEVDYPSPGLSSIDAWISRS